jgi:hypothetical protein
MVCLPEGRIPSEVIGEQGAGKSVWTNERGSNRKAEKIA